MTMKKSTTALLLGLCGLIQSTVSLEQCAPLSADPAIEQEFLLSSSTANGGINCITTPSADEGSFRLTIVPDLRGRYEIKHPVQLQYGDANEVDYAVYTGHGWSSPTIGIYYCVGPNTNITFEDYVEGSTIEVKVEPVAFDEVCTTDLIGYAGYIPVEPREVPPDGAAWSASRYYLTADYFGYKVAGEDVVTLENGLYIDVGGDPGSYDYHSIEITWYLDGKQKRFYGYIDTNATHWNMYEARVYQNDEDWVYFSLLTDVSGERDSCFQRRSLVLKSLDGQSSEASEIRFENLTLATFLPWQDEAAFEACVEPTDFAEIEDPQLSKEFPVFWLTDRYALRADHFEFTIAGQETATMEGSQNVAIGGDPGNDEYMSIEVEWVDGTAHRFYAYFESNATHWNMFEARVRTTEDGDWEYFEGFIGVVAGLRNNCVFLDSLVLTNGRGSKIRFDRLLLGVFLPWDEGLQISPYSDFSLEEEVCPGSSFGLVQASTNGNAASDGAGIEDIFSNSSANVVSILLSVASICVPFLFF